MWLGEVAEVSQLRQLAPDRRGGEVDKVTALQRLGADGHRARRELLDDRPEDGLLPVFHVFSTLDRRVPTTVQPARSGCAGPCRGGWARPGRQPGRSGRPPPARQAPTR